MKVTKATGAPRLIMHSQPAAAAQRPLRNPAFAPRPRAGGESLLAALMNGCHLDLTIGASEHEDLDLVFLWHMHQPDYRDHGATGTAQDARVGAGDTAEGEFVLPWVYLHAMKDYVDMAAHLERHPQIRCVVNLVPVLLEQIEDYAQQFASGCFRDPLLRMLAAPDLDQHRRGRVTQAICCTPASATTIRRCWRPFPRYQRLHDIYRRTRPPTTAVAGAGATFRAPISPTSSPGTTWPGPAKPSGAAIR
jgi:hypothetical protein